MTHRTVLIGSRAIVRDALARLLGEAGFDIVASVTCATTALATPADLLVLDAGKDQDAVVRDVERLRAQLPEARLALVSETGKLDLQHVIDAFRAGLSAYFVEPSAEAFVKSLDLVMMGETIVPRQVILDIPRRGEDVFGLTAREKEVLRHLVAGRQNKQIARLVGSAETTVKVHIKGILRKLRVSNRTQAATWAIANIPDLAHGHASIPKGTSHEIRHHQPALAVD